MTANEQAAGDAANRLTKKIADARRLDAEATGAPWRCESAHDLWREVRHGNRMVVDCALGKDGDFIAHARNHHAALWDLVEAAADHCRAVKGENGRFNVVEMDRTAKNLHAALARLEQVRS